MTLEMQQLIISTLSFTNYLQFSIFMPTDMSLEGMAMHKPSGCSFLAGAADFYVHRFSYFALVELPQEQSLVFWNPIHF